MLSCRQAPGLAARLSLVRVLDYAAEAARNRTKSVSRNLAARQPG